MRVKGDFLVQVSDGGGTFHLHFWNLRKIWIWESIDLNSVWFGRRWNIGWVTSVLALFRYLCCSFFSRKWLQKVETRSTAFGTRDSWGFFHFIFQFDFLLFSHNFFQKMTAAVYVGGPFHRVRDKRLVRQVVSAQHQPHHWLPMDITATECKLMEVKKFSAEYHEIDVK